MPCGHLWCYSNLSEFLSLGTSAILAHVRISRHINEAAVNRMILWGSWLSLFIAVGWEHPKSPSRAAFLQQGRLASSAASILAAPVLTDGGVMLAHCSEHPKANENFGKLSVNLCRARWHNSATRLILRELEVSSTQHLPSKCCIDMDASTCLQVTGAPDSEAADQASELFARVEERVQKMSEQR